MKLYSKFQIIRNMTTLTSIQAVGYGRTNPDKIKQKIAGLLSLVISFQNKIENLKIKLCGFSDFSPQLYYSMIDKNQKGSIDSEDMVFFIKKYKQNFNVDERYMRVMFRKLNNQNFSTDGHSTKLTYFGYLNMIKPFFSTHLASELLNRDSGTSVKKYYNENIIKIFHQLICLTYVVVAEHEQIKEILSDQYLFNVNQFMSILMQNYEQNKNKVILQQIDEQSSHDLTNNQINKFFSEKILATQPKPIVSKNKIKSEGNIGSNKCSGLYLPIFWSIINVHEYEVKEEQMKYLLAYFQCHQYMLGNQKYLTALFLPYSVIFQKKSNVRSFETMPMVSEISLNPQKNNNFQNYKSGTNFLNYVHPNSVRKEQFSYRQSAPSINPQISIKPPKQTTKTIPPHNNLIQQSQKNHELQTPFLQKFLRESNVAKNMSRVKPGISRRENNINFSNNYQNSSSLESSAFVQQSNHHLNVLDQHQKRPIINSSHISKTPENNFHLKNIIQSESMHQSQFMNHNSRHKERQQLRDHGLDIIAEDMQGSILQNFMLK